MERDPQQAHVLQHDVRGADSAREDGRVDAIKCEATIPQQLGSMVRFCDAFIGEVAVDPACEAVLWWVVSGEEQEKHRQHKHLGIPLTLAMAE